MKSTIAFFRQFSSNPLISEMAYVSSLFASANSDQSRADILFDLLNPVIENESGEIAGISSTGGQMMEYVSIIELPELFTASNNQQKMQFADKFHVFIKDCICAFMDLLFRDYPNDERETFIKACRGYIKMLEIKPDMEQAFYRSSRFNDKWKILFDTTTRPNNCIFVRMAFGPVMTRRSEIFDPLIQPYVEMLQEAQRVFYASQNNTPAAQPDITAEETIQPSVVLATATVAVEVSAENISSSSDTTFAVATAVVPGTSFSFSDNTSNADNQSNSSPNQNAL